MDIDDFFDALRRVAGGGWALDPGVVACLLAACRRDDALESLMARERDVLALMAQGPSNHGISRRTPAGSSPYWHTRGQRLAREYSSNVH